MSLTQGTYQYYFQTVEAFISYLSRFTCLCYQDFLE